jgi:hypothetical protein
MDRLEDTMRLLALEEDLPEVNWGGKEYLLAEDDGFTAHCIICGSSMSSKTSHVKRHLKTHKHLKRSEVQKRQL